jgi:predicted metal-binding protein
MAISFIGGRSRSTQREPPTMGKQLVNKLRIYMETNLASDISVESISQ